MSVIGVADIPVNQTLNQLDKTGTPTGNYALVVAEDSNSNQLSVKDIYASAGLRSYDNVGVEALAIVITGLKSDFNVTGAISLGGTGTGRKWIFSAANLDNVKISNPDKL